MAGLIDIGGLFTGPVQAMEGIADEKLKRQAITLAISIAYSQYVTFLYAMGAALEKKRFFGWLGPPLKMMAASVFQMQQLQDEEKIFYFAVPQAMVKDQKLLDSIYYEKIQRK